MRPIDADALIKIMEEYNKVRFDKWPYNEAIREIKEAPTIEVEQRPRGEWNILQKDDNGIHEIECPFCKYSKGGRFASVGITFHKLPPFCEACGASMRTKESKPKKPCPCDTCGCMIARSGCQMDLCSDYQKWKDGEENGN